MSASALTSLLACPARWFLEREAGGASAATAAQGFGLVVHALAERVATGELSDAPAAVDALMEHVDGVWGQIPFRTPWSRSRERAEVRAALARFLAWQQRPGARTLLATERELRAEVTLPDGQRIAVYGYADRLEIDDDGRVVVVDLKTGKYPPTNDEVREHPQLGLYQYAVANGAVDALLDEPAVRRGCRAGPPAAGEPRGRPGPGSARPGARGRSGPPSSRAS